MPVAGITYTGNVDDLSYAAAIFNQSIIDALYANDNVAQMVRVERLGNFASRSIDFPFRPKLTAHSLAEGVDMPYTPYSTSKITLTTGEVGIAMAITDVLSASTIVGDDFYIQDAARAVSEKRLTDITSLGAGFSGNMGTSGAALTEALILAGITTLQSRNVPGPYTAIIHPVQYEDIVTSIGSVLTPAAAGSTNARATTNEFGARQDGGLGSLYNVNWQMTSAVPTATAGVDRAGMIVNASRALGLVEKWAVRTEMQRLPTLRAFEVVISANYGVGEIDDTSGLTILSSST